jgi:hypothetical protein
MSNLVLNKSERAEEKARRLKYLVFPNSVPEARAPALFLPFDQKHDVDTKRPGSEQLCDRKSDRKNRALVVCYAIYRDLPVEQYARL